MENPFRPGFGQYPTVPVRRVEVLRRWSDAFHPDTVAHPAATTMLIGDRGVGKTVLLDIAHDIAAEAGWLVADAAGVDVRSLPARLIDRLWRPTRAARASTQLTVRFGPGAISRTWTPPDTAPPASLRDAVEAILDPRRRPAPTGVLLQVDELHDVPSAQIKQVANELQLLERDGFKVGFVGAGLPSLELGDEAIMPTFLARAWQPELGPVDDAELARVVVETLATVDRACEPDALDRLVTASGGLPYAMQLIGWHLVDGAADRAAGRSPFTSDAVAAVTPTVHRELIRALRIPYDLTPQRAQFLAAMVDHPGPVDLAVICERLGRTPQQLSTVRAWLLRNGYLDAPGRGELEYRHVGLRAVVATDPATVR